MSVIKTGEWMKLHGDVKLELGDVAFLDGKYGDYEISGIWGARRRREGNVNPSLAGIYVGDLGTCFAICILGRRGTIMVHVPDHVGPFGLAPAELSTVTIMRANFARLWSTYFSTHLDPPTVTIVRGPYTVETDLTRAINRICPEINAFCANDYQCKGHPDPPESRHGTVLAIVDYRGTNGKEVYVEGVRVL